MLKITDGSYPGFFKGPNRKHQILGSLLIVGFLAVSCSSFAQTSLPGDSTQKTDRGISSWRTYRNSSLGYEFSYPANWRLEEGISTGYPYVTLVDPVAQALPDGATEITQGALIQISAERYTAVVVVEEYVRNNIRPVYNENGELEEVFTEGNTSTVWGTQGIFLIQHRGDVLQHNHAALINYPEGSLLLQIMLTIPDSTASMTESYIDTFNQITGSLDFSKTSTTPEPVVTKSP